MAKGKFERWRTEEGLTLLRGWARDGLTDEIIAKKIGVRRQTIYEWCARYPDIADALRRGRECVDYHVEDKLLQRVEGYEYVKSREEYRLDEHGNEVLDRVIRTVEHVPPDTQAISMWLRNRQRHKWREDRAEELPEGGGCMILPEVTDGDE